MQMSLSKLQGHYVIRHSAESEKTELVFSAIYSTNIIDNTAIYSTNIIDNTARKGYTAYKFVNALEGTAYHKTEKWRNVRLLA